MTTIRQILNFVGVGIIVCSCATQLDRSEADRLMRFEGSYSCDKFTHESSKRRETLAEADASRVRCARDTWAIQGNEVFLTRSLFHTRDCEVPLGRIEFKAPLERLPNGVAVRGTGACQLVRSNVSWLGERSGKCLLKDFALNRSYPLRNKNCHSYIPEVCKSDRARIELTAPQQALDDEHRGSVSELTIDGTDPNSKGVCQRYAAG